MHSERRGFAAFSPGTKSILSNAGHGINHGIAKLEEILFLLADKWIESAFAMMVVAH
jgi:hypothetical protein